MPRQARIDTLRALHHIIVRGIDRKYTDFNGDETPVNRIYDFT